MWSKNSHDHPAFVKGKRILPKINKFIFAYTPAIVFFKYPIGFIFPE